MVVRLPHYLTGLNDPQGETQAPSNSHLRTMHQALRILHVILPQLTWSALVKEKPSSPAAGPQESSHISCREKASLCVFHRLTEHRGVRPSHKEVLKRAGSKWHFCLTICLLHVQLLL